jgi:para-nitrobenzyl esterase
MIARSLLSLTVLAALVPSPAIAAPPDPTVVRVDTGWIRGQASAGTVRFQGVPYAAPPVGTLRWSAPRPAAGWSGVRDGTAPGNRCPQSFGGPVIGAEDCLYLNVTRPARPGRVPVIVWLHGGGMKSGSGADYDPARLVTTGEVMVVTVNYRLGALGFLSHPALRGSGNFGLQDQAAALRWVRRNIAAFGGDPRQVTLAGQSAGARSVCAHLASPGSRGLFQRAIVQSGACASPVMTRSAADRKGVRAAREVGCAGGPDVAGCLRRTGVTGLLGTLQGVGTSVTGTVADDAWGPVAGTPFLPWQPGVAIRFGAAAGVPLLIGSTRDEMRSFVPYAYDLSGKPLTAEGYAGALAEAFGDHAHAVLARYPVRDYPKPVLALSTVLTDWGGRIGACPTLATARAAARFAPVYSYELTEDSGEVIGGIPFGAPHGSDLPFLFEVPWADPAPAGLSATMVGYWAAFARTGDPNGAGRPVWRSFRSGGTVLGLSSAVIGPTPFAAEHHCGFWTP